MGRVPIPPAPSRQARGMLAQTRAWLAAQGYDVGPATLAYGPSEMADATAFYNPANTTITAGPRMSRAYEALGRQIYSGHPADWAFDAEAGRNILHELFHTRQRPDGNGALEEAVAESLARDVYPAWSKRFLGSVRQPDTTTYGYQVDWLRKASAKAAGAPWNARPARLWRRGLLTGDRTGVDLTGLPPL